MNAITLQQTLQQAEQLAPEFDLWFGSMDEQSRGIATSEGLFIAAALGAYRPRQIIESGRARGQSTFLLGSWFSEVRVLSIEREPGHADAAFAMQRLSALPNVSCLFGDSRVLMPALALEGDVLVIDGPKNFRAVRLALQAARRVPIACAFIHDTPRGTPVRWFIEANVPGAFFSDDYGFVQRFCKLDRYEPADKLAKWSDSNFKPVNESYAGTFACLPFGGVKPSRSLVFKSRLARVGQKLGRG
jgi:hypothetical protein